MAFQDKVLFWFGVFFIINLPTKALCFIAATREPSPSLELMILSEFLKIGGRRVPFAEQSQTSQLQWIVSSNSITSNRKLVSC